MRLDPRVIEEIAKEEPEYAAQLAREYRKAMIVLAREDPSWFCAYVLRNATDGSQIYQHSDHEALHRAILDCPRVAIWTHPGLGKAMPLDTEVPTPEGWKLLGDLQVGDSVFSRKGTSCTVRSLTPVQMERPVYRLTFDDKSSCLADAEHNWLVSDIWSRHEHRQPFVRTTAQLLEKPLKQHGKRTWAVPVAAAVEYPKADLPIPPYALGAWLGDGTLTSTQLTFHGDDCAVYERCIALTGAADTRKPIPGREHLFRGYIGGLDALHALRTLGVSAPQGRKHIPTAYKTASIEQRLELLRGLMDTDGYVSKQSGMMEFCNTNQVLAEDLLELVRSLGIKAKLSSKLAKCNGKITGTAYYVHFSTRKPVFFLARKAAKLAAYEDARSTGDWKYVTSIEPVDSVPVRCIEVDSADHSFLVSRAYTATHNCVTRDAKVLYEDGTWREAGDLQAGDKLLTWSPEKHALIPVTASLIDNGKHPILHIKTADGALLKVTENHPLLRSDLSWVRADQLEVGEEVVALNHLDLDGTTPDEVLPPEEAEILGYLYAGRVGKNESVIVRRMNGSEKWSARRQKMLESAGWEVVPYKEHAFQVKNTKKAAMSPALFLASLSRIEQGWPVDFLPEVYQLKTGSICRLLTAFFSAAYFRLHTTGDLNRNSAIAGTFGVADTRLPLYVGHTNRNTLESVRRLNLRTGAKLSLRVAGRGQPLKGTHGGIFPPMRARTARVNRHYKLYVLPEDLGRFWPTQQVPETPPALLKKVRILSITKSVKPAQTWGIEIAEKEHSYIQEGLVVHNTNQIAIGHVLWRIGKNPNCSIAMVCNTSEMAERTVSAIKQYIAYSQEFKDVFPDIKPGEIWSGTKFTVSRETIRRDPTLQAVGLTGNIVGARLDGLVLDDVDNIDSTLTEAARDQTEQRIRKQVVSRLDAAGWAVAIGNVWHEKDLMHRLVKSGWKALKFPVLKYDDESGELISRDPSMFPMERIYQIRDFDQGPIEFERLYMLKARIDGEQRFRQEWIDQALELGKQQILMRQGVPKVPTGCRTVTGVDLGVKPKAKNDPTVITTILEVPKAGNQYEYQILNIVKGRWNAQEIMDKIKEQQRLFMSEVWVESNGAQDFLIQLMNMSGLNYKINAFRTGMNKYDPMFGVEAIAAEMALNKWYIPSWDGTREGCEEEVDELIEEMLSYQPSNHTGDLLMSLWIARDGARQSREKSQGKVQYGRLRLGRNR